MAFFGLVKIQLLGQLITPYYVGYAVAECLSADISVRELNANATRLKEKQKSQKHMWNWKRKGKFRETLRLCNFCLMLSLISRIFWKILISKQWNCTNCTNVTKAKKSRQTLFTFGKTAGHNIIWRFFLMEKIQWICLNCLHLGKRCRSHYNLTIFLMGQIQ